VTNVGDFFPSTGQVAGGMWKQAERPNNPDMYKVDARAIKSAWEDYFGQFFDSGFSLYKNDASIGELLAPYISVILDNQPQLGIPNLMRPHPAPFVTPSIFKKGPGTPDTWTECLFVEEDLPKKLPDWPHDRIGDKNAKFPAETPDLNLRPDHYIGADGYTTEDWSKAVKRAAPFGALRGQKLPAGYRCVPWPTGAERITAYQRPEVAIIGPACDHLIKMQERCLERTLVSAYVRPEDVDGLEAHGAFRQNKALRDKCKQVRSLLLKHDARYRVNLKDAETADPAFAQKLRDSGVNNSIGQMTKHLGRLGAGISDDDSPPPPPPEPAGGLPFGDLGRPSEEGGRWKIAATAGGAAAAAGAAYYWIRGRHREPAG